MRHPIGAFRSSLGLDSEDLNRQPHILAHLQGTQSPHTKANLAKEPKFPDTHSSNSTVRLKLAFNKPN
jgi:hypothetical protein